MPSPVITLRVEILGRVQGVGYRYWTVEEAKKRQVSGWVRNRKEGYVEAIFQGEKVNVDDLLMACYKGPAFANVQDIKTGSGEYDGPNEFSWQETV